jgi:hypothetical protein
MKTWSFVIRLARPSMSLRVMQSLNAKTVDWAESCSMPQIAEFQADRFKTALETRAPHATVYTPDYIQLIRNFGW